MGGALQIRTSDRVESLVDALARAVEEPLSSPLVAEVIVVPSRPLAGWLALRLAEIHGVWANTQWLTPESLLPYLHERVLGPATTDDDFAAATLTWSIAAALPSLLSRPEFAPVAGYLSDDTDTSKRIALSRRLARTFRLYLVHRPELLSAWERGAEDKSDATAAWEAELFRALVAKHGGTHIARRNRELLDALRADGPNAPGALPERIAVFLPESLPATTIDVLHVLAKRLPVSVFVRDAGAAHALAPSMGARGRELVGAFASKGDVVPVATGSTAKVPEIAVHSCHGPMRECEVLRDQLLAALDSNRSLEARDILVLCPDLDRYAPVIDAVFGIEERAPGYLPYRIVDRPARHGLAVVEAFLALLELAPSRLLASDVVDLLAREPVRMKFGLGENEIDVVREWVVATNIRWAEDEAHRAEVGQPSFRANTWRFGLDRLLVGYAMGGAADPILYQDCLPYDDVEGGATTTLGGLAAFCEELFAIRRSLAGRAPLAAWRDRLTNALERLFAAGWQSEFQHQMIRDALDDLAGRAERAAFVEEVPLAVVRDSLSAELDERASAHEHAPGGITFASFSSTRCVPAPIVVLLGMNDGDFPRPTRADGFDLMARAPLPGEPSRRNEDRQAFLDALLCARARVIVTYVGQSIADNRERPPSVVVSELIDSLGDKGKDVVVKHALHAFSPRYFGAGDDARLFSHATALCDGATSMASAKLAAEPFVTGPLAPSTQVARTVTIDDLARFFEHPIRGFMQARLGVSLGRDQTVLEDREPLALDELDKWILGTPLIERARQGEDITRAPRDLVAAGSLPLGIVGEYAYGDVVPAVTGIADALKPLLGAKPPPATEIELAIGGTRVVGWLRNVGKKGLVHYTYSRLQGKNRIATWVRHLALLASGHGSESWLVTRTKDASSCERYRAVDDADDELATLVDLYWRGLEAALLFFADPSFEYAAHVPAIGHENAVHKARRSFTSQFGPASCPYVRRVLGDRDPFENDFEPFGSARDKKLFPPFGALATTIVKPLLAHEEHVEEKGR